MKIGKSITTIVAGAMAVACLTSVAACGPGSSSSTSNASSEPVSTDLGNKNIELKLWDGAGLKTFDDQLIAAFQKKYPNVTIKATYDPDNTSAQNGPRIISAADTPDIARITDINSAVRGRHLVNLDDYAKAYKWNLPESQTEIYQVDSSGKIGSGSLYAVPDGVSMTGLYWNRKVAKSLGITEAPTTIEQLEADMKKATDAGTLAMMMPAKEGGTSYIYQALLTSYEGRDAVQDWILQKDGATFSTDGALKAAKQIKGWQDAGYFSSDALALDGSTALSRFCNGEALFFPSGSWYSASINDALGDDAGWVAFPGVHEGEESAASNAVTACGIQAQERSCRVPQLPAIRRSPPDRGQQRIPADWRGRRAEYRQPTAGPGALLLRKPRKERQHHRLHQQRNRRYSGQRNHPWFPVTARRHHDAAAIRRLHPKAVREGNQVTACGASHART